MIEGEIMEIYPEDEAEKLELFAHQNEEAVNTFKAELTRVNDGLELLSWFVDNQECKPEEKITWDHIGPVTHVVEQLQLLIVNLGITK